MNLFPHSKRSLRILTMSYGKVEVQMKIMKSGNVIMARVKEDIVHNWLSRPFDPKWITRVDATDINFRSTFAEFLPPPPATTATEATDDVSETNCDFRPWLPTSWYHSILDNLNEPTKNCKIERQVSIQNSNETMWNYMCLIASFG